MGERKREGKKEDDEIQTRKKTRESDFPTNGRILNTRSVSRKSPVQSVQLLQEHLNPPRSRTVTKKSQKVQHDIIIDLSWRTIHRIFARRLAPRRSHKEWFEFPCRRITKIHIGKQNEPILERIFALLLLINFFTLTDQ